MSEVGTSEIQSRRDSKLRPGAIVGLTDTGRPVLARVAALEETLIHVRYHHGGQAVDVTKIIREMPLPSGRGGCQRRIGESP